MDKDIEMPQVIIADVNSAAVGENVEMVLGVGGGGSSQVNRRSGGDLVEERPWTPEEDEMLSRLATNFGPGNWTLIGREIGGRSGKSCRLRWCNQLAPRHNPFTDEEDLIILQAHSVVGNNWSAIAKLLLGRTEDEIKKHWEFTLKRRAIEQGKLKVDPGLM